MLDVPSMAKDFIDVDEGRRGFLNFGLEGTFGNYIIAIWKF
jgi:hypothetical protein